MFARGPAIVSCLSAAVLTAPNPVQAQCDAEFSGVWGGSCNAVASSGRYAFAGLGDSLTVIDVLDPADPVVLEALELGAVPRDIELLAGHAYIAAGSAGMIIVDVRAPAAPVEVARYRPSPSFITAIDSVQGAIVAANGQDGLHVVGVSNPADPRLLGVYREVPFVFTEVVASNRYAFVGSTRREIVVVDLFDPTRPTRVTSASLAGTPRALDLSGSTLLAVDDARSLVSFDVLDPTRPRRLDDLTFGGAAPTDVVSTGGYAYICSPTLGIQVVDARNPADLQAIGLSDAARAPLAAEVRSGLIFFADDANGLVIADFSRGVDPLALGLISRGGDATDLAWTGDAAAAAIEPSFGLVTLEIGPGAPEPRGSLILPRPMRLSIAGDRALVLGEDGLTAVSLHEPDQPLVLGSLALAAGAQDMAVAGDFAIVTRGVFNVWCIGIADPANMLVLDSLDLPGAGRVAAAEHNAFVANFAFGEIVVLDFLNPFNLREVGRYDFGPGLAVDLEPRGTTLFVASWHSLPPFARLQAVDVEDPAHPALISSIELPAFPASLAIDGATAWVGLEGGGAVAVDISDPGSMRLAASLDGFASPAAIASRAGRVITADGSTGVRAHNSPLPIILDHPRDGEVPLGGTLVLAIDATGREPLSFLWRRDGVGLVDDGRIDGALTPTLTIRGTVFEDAGRYDCLASNDCASAATRSANITVFCAGDFNSDGQLNAFDFLAFQGAFGRGQSRADLAAPYGVFNLFDFLAFQSAFGAGC